MFKQIDRPSQANLSKLIKVFGSRLAQNGPRNSDEINTLGSMFDLELPSDYRQFLNNYGAINIDDLYIFGLAELDRPELSVENITLMLRLTYDDMPLELLPIEALGDNHYTCLLCTKGKSITASVVLLDVNNIVPINQLTVLAPGFRDYLYNRLLMLSDVSQPVSSNEPGIEKALQVFEKHVLDYQKEFQYDHAKGGKLPRNHDWRPYRYCIQDVVFGITVLRHLRDSNCLQVDVFLTAEISEYDPLAGAIALTSFLLSEAYKCGGTMEIRFTKEVEGGQVPQELQTLAQRYDIHFKQAKNGRVEADEAKALYAALTEFSPELQSKITELERAGKVKMARACYVVHHGVWTKEQVETIVLGSENPDSILGGQAQPHQRHLYYHDLMHARAALLGGMLDRILIQQNRISEEGIEYDMEDDLRPLKIRFDGSVYAKQYSSEEDIPIPWLYPDNQSRNIQGSMTFNVLIRARDTGDMQLHLSSDIKQAEAYRLQTQHPTLLLLPQNFMILSEKFRQQFYEQAKTAKVGLLICPDPIMTFDADATQRLARSRILRQ